MSGGLDGVTRLFLKPGKTELMEKPDNIILESQMGQNGKGQVSRPAFEIVQVKVHGETVHQPIRPGNGLPHGTDGKTEEVPGRQHITYAVNGIFGVPVDTIGKIPGSKFLFVYVPGRSTFAVNNIVNSRKYQVYFLI
jgi:hypothetical protein